MISIVKKNMQIYWKKIVQKKDTYGKNIETWKT